MEPVRCTCCHPACTQGKVVLALLRSDVICEFPLREMLAFHRKTGAEGTILVTQVRTPILAREDHTGGLCMSWQTHACAWKHVQHSWREACWDGRRSPGAQCACTGHWQAPAGAARRQDAARLGRDYHLRVAFSVARCHSTEVARVRQQCTRGHSVVYVIPFDQGSSVTLTP